MKRRSFLAVLGGATMAAASATISGRASGISETQKFKQVSVADYGAKGDGVTDDRPAIQAAIDDLLTLPQSVDKRLYLPRPTQFYRIGSLQSPQSKFGPNAWNTDATYAFMFPHAKNLAIEGEAGERVRLVMDPSFVAPEQRMFGINQEINKPPTYYDLNQSYYASLIANDTNIAPVVPGRNWFELTQGTVTDFPIGDIVVFIGADLITMFAKIIGVDAATNRIFVDRPINLKFGVTVFKALTTVPSGADKVYVECETWFRVAQLTLALSLDDGSILNTKVSATSLDAQGSFISITTPIPAGRTLPKGNAVTMLGHHGLDAVRSTKSYQRLLNTLVDGKGQKIYPFVTIDDPFWCVTPENIVLKNLSIEGGYFQLHASGVLNLTIENCSITSPVGEIFLLGAINGFNIVDSDIRQLAANVGGLQLSPASTRYINFLRSTFYSNVGAGLGECFEAAWIESCKFVGYSFYIAQFHDLVIESTKFLPPGNDRLATQINGGTLLQIGSGSTPYEGESIILDKCELTFSPRRDAAGIEQPNQYLITTYNLFSLTIKNCLMEARLTTNSLSLSAERIMLEGNKMTFTDLSYPGGIGGSTKLTAKNTPAVIRDNRIRVCSSALAPMQREFFGFGWGVHGDIGYAKATFENNRYDGFKTIFAIDEEAPAGLVLSNILLRDQIATNRQDGFQWYDPNHFFPLMSVDPDGIRIWKAAAVEPVGGIVNVNDKIAYVADGVVTKTKICVIAGGIVSGIWSDTINYPTNRWVVGSDSKVYRSILHCGPASSVKDPTLSPAYWQVMASRVAFFRTGS